MPADAGTRLRGSLEPGLTNRRRGACQTARKDHHFCHPLEGLAPIVVSEVLAALRRIREETGTATIIVEQKAALVLGLADEAIILDRGRIVHRGSGAALLADRGLLDAHLGARERVPH